MDGGTNTSTAPVARTTLDMANDIKSDRTNAFAQEMTRLISESRETRDQLERMGDILGIIRRLLSCIWGMPSKQKNIAKPAKDGIIILTTSTEAIDKIRPAAIQRTQGQMAASRRNGVAEGAEGDCDPDQKAPIRGQPGAEFPIHEMEEGSERIYHNYLEEKDYTTR